MLEIDVEASSSAAPERVWALLVTWGQPVDEDQGQALQAQVDTFDIGRERSAAGDARSLPRT